MTTDSSLGRWYSVPGLLALVLVCAGAVGMEAASPKASPLRSAEQTPLAPSDTQHIALEEGWNLISSRLVPDAPSMEAVFAPIADAVKVVRGPSGAVYKPGDGTNTIGDWEVQAGYEVYVTSSQTLVIEGRPATGNESGISLQKGWNTISYLPSAAYSPTQALVSVGDTLAMLKDGTGNVSIPNEDIDQFGVMRPGDGFKVYASANSKLVYPDVNTRTYAEQCLAKPGVVLPSNFGEFAPDTPNDSLQRVENAASLNAAIASAPSPGTVCLPQGEYYLFPTSYSGRSTHNIEVLRDSITIWGTGDNQDGNGTGLHTRGSYLVNENNEVIRGNGLAIEGSDTEVFQDYTLRDFEIDGESGYTGETAWPADPADGSGFDLSHKGVKITSGSGGTTGTAMRNILIEGIWLHGYQGEITHAPGWSGSHITNLTLRNSMIGDANGGSMNFQGDQLTIENNTFRNTQGWGEIFSWGWSIDIIGNKFKNQHIKTNGYSIHGHDINKKDSLTVKNNTFQNCNTDGGGGRSIAFTGGFTGPGIIKNNTFLDCQLAVFQYIGNPDDPTDLGQTPWNENITIKENTIKSDNIDRSIFVFGNYNRNVVVMENTFQPRNASSATGDGAVNYCCGTTLKDFTISDNIFKNLSSESHDGGGGGDTPLFDGTNTYTDVGWNIHQPDVGGTYNIEGARLEPRISGNATGEMYLPTGDRFADGHTVTLKKRKPYGTPQFSTTNPSVSVPEDTSLAEVGQELRFQYDEAAEKWQLVE
ncbi:hypothetical protein GGP72_002981 [Salinibacter ruber]|uniref:Right handed beta helix domain-containing protein n=1 Tax=Salinibacter ruber TaxID=146919 RepID=A0A9X2Q8R9_9BACT|nr:right-handed parallel beta-helix repeat-containing protein [Salinibacter ruber]MCS3678756.1 hypothetical protein [Salinibacter ruber]MCS3682321.1 hypothetical protein [Salinibacter ruber]